MDTLDSRQALEVTAIRTAVLRHCRRGRWLQLQLNGCRGGAIREISLLGHEAKHLDLDLAGAGRGSFDGEIAAFTSDSGEGLGSLPNGD
ncbi:MAG: hypothetical protein ABI693_23055 [Bryobacteraceae bacterium]